MQQIVPRYSATLPGYTAIGIRADHKDMVRFASESDPGFISIVGELQRWIKDIKITTENSDKPRKDVPDHLDGKSGMSNKIKTDGITIWGDVKQSNIVSGDQAVWGGVTFRD
jgi:protein SERAC1